MRREQRFLPEKMNNAVDVVLDSPLLLPGGIVLFTLVLCLAVHPLVWILVDWLSRKVSGGNKAKDRRSRGEIRRDVAVFNAAVGNITPLDEGWDHRKEMPERIWTFKPKFYMTMGLQTLDPSSLLLIDSLTPFRLYLRNKLLENHSTTCISTPPHPSSHAAVHELYSFLVQTYLPSRYPTLFHVRTPLQTLHCSLTGASIPLTPPLDPRLTLCHLGQQIEDDFLLLLPTPDPPHHYALRAYVTCFPSGFNPADKLNKPLRAIHGPVPGYERTIASSMDRYFASLAVGKFVKRFNWSIATERAPACLFGAFSASHGGGAWAGAAAAALHLDPVDPEDCSLRVERQCLFRLPRSRAVVFSFRSYLYPLRELREAGRGPDLAEAIEALESVEGMAEYKRADEWGEAVCGFLRAKDGSDTEKER